VVTKLVSFGLWHDGQDISLGTSQKLKN